MRCQDELKEFLGSDYHDYGLVVCLPNGRPCEGRILLKAFAQLRDKAGLPKVVFHSLRHSSTTYKLELDVYKRQGLHRIAFAIASTVKNPKPLIRHRANG